GPHADADKDRLLLLQDVGEAHQLLAVAVGVEIFVARGIAKADALLFLLLIGRLVVDGVLPLILPAGRQLLFLLGHQVIGQHQNSSVRRSNHFSFTALRARRLLFTG